MVHLLYVFFIIYMYIYIHRTLFILSYLVLSCLILSYLILSYLILSYLILSPITYHLSPITSTSLPCPFTSCFVRFIRCSNYILILLTILPPILPYQRICCSVSSCLLYFPLMLLLGLSRQGVIHYIASRWSNERYDLLTLFE